MEQLTFSWSNVLAGDGVAVSLTGMSIVFFALVIISLCIAALPRVLVFVNKFLPEPEEKAPAPRRPLAGSDDEAIAVAAAYGYHNS